MIIIIIIVCVRGETKPRGQTNIIIIILTENVS